MSIAFGLRRLHIRPSHIPRHLPGNGPIFGKTKDHLAPLHGLRLIPTGGVGVCRAKYRIAALFGVGHMQGVPHADIGDEDQGRDRAAEDAAFQTRFTLDEAHRRSAQHIDGVLPTQQLEPVQGQVLILGHKLDGVLADLPQSPAVVDLDGAVDVVRHHRVDPDLGIGQAQHDRRRQLRGRDVDRFDPSGNRAAFGERRCPDLNVLQRRIRHHSPAGGHGPGQACPNSRHADTHDPPTKPHRDSAHQALTQSPLLVCSHRGRASMT